jgi:hypothetical protein
MHFTYAENLTKDELMQGDVLERTPALDKLLSEVHPYYFGKLKNQYFMVLTQSCDLVPRPPSGETKARYISLSPVRTLDHVIDLQMQVFRASVKAELPVISDKSKNRMSEFLQRLFNNNVPDYFLLAANGPRLTSDYAVFLQLSIAIRADLHLQTCLDAKFLQLTQAFQAKLGWLVGQLYSRVGTTDWSPTELTAKIKSVLKDAAICVPESTIDYLEAHYQELSNGNPDAVMSQSQISKIVARAPTRKGRVFERIETMVIDTLGQGRINEAKRLCSQLKSDEALTTLLK